MGCGASASELGLASFYKSSYDTSVPGGLTAAHRSLPMGSQVRVLNLDNGRAVVVKIVDRGPFIDGRIIDVSPAVAATLGFLTAGLAHVRIDPVSAESGSGVPRQAAATPHPTSPYEICRYGADRLGYQRGDSAAAVAAPARRAVGCEDLPSGLFAFAQRSEDLTPLVARSRAFLTETQAAASIPVSAIAAVPERVPDRRTALTRAAGSLAVPTGAFGEVGAAASIPVSALVAAPERQASSRRPANGCGDTASCEGRERRSASNPIVSFFARLGAPLD
jgi:rare lipoprotein A